MDEAKIVTALIDKENLSIVSRSFFWVAGYWNYFCINQNQPRPHFSTFCLVFFQNVWEEKNYALYKKKKDYELIS
ncbi:hypothetical protein [Alteribacillus sp. YIM 98480]|uniref:hypothetical protein n=1 Tax=Alteribacillus sp. YIM 98480 TaxID=2606599 RepID=UPI00131C4696|nr:hypothetical protein [Alteribacillus sp. YIM 98480]